MESDKKILLTTAFINSRDDLYDWVSTNIKWRNRFSRKREISFALRFLRENLPGIEIMEYPTWDAYTKKLEEGWDVVGISFYLNETERVKQMVDYARKHSSAELWGGNYGVLTDGMDERFDKVFHGYAEEKVGDILGVKIDIVKHPPLVNTISFNDFKIALFGTLFTTRGCTHKCKFCQTPIFDPRSHIIPFDSIEEVLKHYKANGINNVAIFDENFGLVPKHAREVAAMLKKYDFTWGCMARADFVAKHVDDWKAGGGKFVAAGVGVESFNEEVLRDVKKRLDADKILASIKKIKSHGVGILAYYMIGFPIETKESIKTDLKRLATFKNEVNQVTIITPLPKTPLWYELDEKYGIFEKDYEKFDTKHLTWHHPTIGKQEMENLLDWGLGMVNPRRRVFRLLHTYFETKAKESGVNVVGKFLKNVNRYNNGKTTDKVQSATGAEVQSEV